MEGRSGHAWAEAYGLVMLLYKAAAPFTMPLSGAHQSPGRAGGYVGLAHARTRQLAVQWWFG